MKSPFMKHIYIYILTCILTNLHTNNICTIYIYGVTLWIYIYYNNGFSHACLYVLYKMYVYLYSMVKEMFSSLSFYYFNIMGTTMFTGKGQNDNFNLWMCNSTTTPPSEIIWSLYPFFFNDCAFNLIKKVLEYYCGKD